MKKIFMMTALFLCLAAQAQAETIVVIDANGTVVQQIVTAPSTVVTTPSTVVTAPTTVVTAPTTVVQTQPALTVVREAPTPNTYYYDQETTGAAIVAGVTSAVVGGLIFEGFHRPGHRQPAHFGAPRPRH